MGVLDAVMQYKARKEAQDAQAAQAIPQAVQAFITGRQEAQNNQLKMLSVQAELAGRGLKLTPQGIIRDESLTSPLEQLVSQSKAAEAAKTMGNRPLWESLTGQGSQQAPQQPQATGVQDQQPAQSSSLIDQMQAPEIDKFTGKPTTAGVQQEAINKQIEAQGLEKAKTEAKNVEKVKGMEAIEGDLDSLLSLYNKIPAHDKGPLEGRTRGVVAKAIGTDTALTTFEDSSGLVLANISREFGGEKGVLTDQDIKRIKAAFPNKTDTDDIANAKIVFIKDFVKRKIEVKTGGKDQATKQSTATFKAGDVRSKNGKNYVRQEDGSWLPQ